MDKLVRSVADRVVLCDLDGVVWVGHQPIPGSVEAVAVLRQHGWRVVFVTNASFRSRVEVVDDLARIGVAADGDVLTSAMAAALLVSPGEHVLVCGGVGLYDEVDRRGAHPIYAHELDSESFDVDSIDAVVVGLYRELSYASLSIASRAVSNGARFVASNTDPVYPTPRGPVPGGGAIVAAVSAATQVEPVVAGKPHAPMADLVVAQCGQVADGTCWMIGDRHDTDGAFAARLGVRFGHVLSGTVTDAGPCDARTTDLAEMAALIVGELS